MAASLALWELKEASSGNAPTSAGDSDASPVNLTITAGANGSAWMTDAEGNGYNWIAGGSETTMDSGALNGSKIETALNNATQASWVFKMQRGGSDLTVPVVAIADVTDTSYFEFYADGRIFWGTQEGASINSNPSYTTNMIVVAFVVDSTQAVAADRIKIYIGGTLAASAGAGISLNQTINNGVAWSNLHVYFGRNPGVASSYNGVLKIAALYSTALSASDVSTITTNMTANDDTNPDAQPVATVAWLRA